MLLVQSMREPDWSKLAEGYLKCDAECKVYDPHFEVGQRLRFRLRANPTFKVSSKNEKLGEKHAGKRWPKHTEIEQIKWLVRKGELLGFRIPGRFIDVEDPEPDEPDQIANFRVDTIPEGRFFIGKANLKQIETEEKLRDPLASRGSIRGSIACNESRSAPYCD